MDDSRPARYLVEPSAAALMLVWDRGAGEPSRGLVLGSVSQYCAHHATCPVVIVRGDNDLG